MPAGERFINVDQRIAAADYFRAMEIPLAQGRLFTARGHAHRAARRRRRRAHGAGAVAGRRRAGQALPHRRHRRQPTPWITVVGVVGDVKQDTLDADSRMAMYFPQTQLTPRGINIVLRTTGDPAALVPAVRREIARHGSRPAGLRRADHGRARRCIAGAPPLFMLLLTIFAVLAPGLAAVGIYGVIAFLVAPGDEGDGHPDGARRHAASHRPAGRPSRHGDGGVGVVLGVAGAFAMTRLMQSLLFGVGATDPATYGLVAALVGITAVAASFIPARRAARLDPMRSLR